MATALSEPDGYWNYDSDCPKEWPDLLAQCGGGFFHTPAGLLTSAPPGEPIYARFIRNGYGRVEGIALGVRRGCRFSLGKRHTYFPTLPAVGDSLDPDHALHSLVHGLRQQGAAEVRVDSFDAPWEVRPRTAGETSRRLEYLVQLDRPEQSRERAVDHMHRRQIRRGDREGWSIRGVEGEEAGAIMSATYGSAVARARRLGRGFDDASPDAAVRAARGEPGPGWGVSVYAASGGELLSAALIGWANGAAYYLAGGSTPAGYRRGVSAWLHWEIMRRLAARGFVRYNLGGTPRGAAVPGHPLHGLHRFKCGLGASLVERRSAKWVLSPAHLTAHHWARWTTAPEAWSRRP